MVVQQGKLGATDTTKDMANYYSDAVVTAISDVDRAIHNATQFVRLVLQRPQPVTSQRGQTGAPNTLFTKAEYIDSVFTPSPVSNTNLVVIGFANGQLVDTAEIVLYSTQPLDTTAANWNVATSSDNTDAQFILANFQATSLAVAESTLSDAETGGNGIQFKYNVTFTAPAIGGLQYWRITHTTSEFFNDLTEVEIVKPLRPTISYFDTDGNFASSTFFDNTTADPDILDAAYDNLNNVFYTIRFNSDTVGTSNISLGDDFSDADAGTASGTNNFNTARWTESSTNSSFLRTSDELSYNVATGKGQLETTYTLGDFNTTIAVNPQTITTEDMWFVIRALDTNNRVLMQEGVGFTDTPTTTGVFFGSTITNFVDAVADSELRELRPLWHNSTDGVDAFQVTFTGTTWIVSGTLTGALTNAQTGVLYDETVDANTPIEFLISSTSDPSNGEKFTFDLTTVSGAKEPTATGTLLLDRSGSDFKANNVFTTPVTISSDAVTIELFGNTDGTVNISADDYVITGSGTFPNVPVFTVERIDDDGDLDTTTPIVIDAFDVIGDSSLTYNDFIDGRVQIAATASGTGGGSIYIKINSTLYKYPNNISLGSEDGSSATVSTIGQIAKDGTHSLAWTHRSSIGGLPFLTYIEFDSGLDIVHLRTIDKDTLLDTTDAKEVLLNIPGYSTSQEFRVFYDQNDFDTLYFVDSSTNLQAFNTDDRISAFMAVNAEDTTLPAGTAQQTFVNADVINAWGESLDGKVVTFAVSAGDGAVSPSTDTTVSGGRATSQFTVGSTVGVSTITASVTEA